MAWISEQETHPTFTVGHVTPLSRVAVYLCKNTFSLFSLPKLGFNLL